MGAAARKEVSEYVASLLTSDVLDGDADAAALLTHLSRHESQICGGAELYDVAAPIAAAVARTTSTTGRLRWLLRLCSETVRRCTEAAPVMEPGAPAVLHVAELLLRHVLRLSKGRSAPLVSALEAGGPAAWATPTSVTSAAAVEDTATLLCRVSLAFLAAVPLDAATVAMHLEVLRLLLTMTSSALHHGTDLDEDAMDLFTELAMASPLLGNALAMLLRVVVDWGTPGWAARPPVLYHSGYEPSLLNLFRVFGGGGAVAARDTSTFVLEVATTTTTAAAAAAATNTGGGGGASVMTYTLPKDPAAVLVPSSSCWDQVGRHAAALLCVLLVHQKGTGRNPALDYVAALHDGTPVRFVSLLKSIRLRLLQFPEMSILLYVLLHDHHAFLHTVLADDAALLVSTAQALLELTYRTCRDTTRLAGVPASSAAGATGTAASSSSSSSGGGGADGDVVQGAVLGRLLFHLRAFAYPFINFMSSTLLLLLSQDRVVNRLLCSTPCLPGHVLEQQNESATVGALAVTVMVLGITKGLNERNEALIAVFAPCLVNMAPSLHDMDAYTAQRVSALLTLILRKLHRASTLLASAPAATSTTTSIGAAAAAAASSAADGSAPPLTAVASAEDVAALADIVAMYLRQLRTVVEGVEALLRGADRHNEHLVYELLYARGRLLDDVDAAVEARLPHAQETRELLANVSEMIRNCEADIASSSDAQNPYSIMAILRRGQQQQQQQQQQSPRRPATAGVEGNGGSGGAEAGGSDAVSAAADVGAAAAAAVATAPDALGGVDGAAVDLVYSYDESPHSYDFFGPFVWATLLSAGRHPGSALWCRHCTELALFPH
ncbi:Dyggve-Melchior-Clausen syndrome protein [Novymonas esmeraldas]|uniref:Dymeclin n=1 Tax=Novymonas esmeraldas TaxID=1808958 RepID=A0AAW0EM88_9TRYP